MEWTDTVIAVKVYRNGRVKTEMAQRRPESVVKALQQSHVTAEAPG